MVPLTDRSSSRTLAPVASVARLAYQIPMANGTDTTVIYMIVTLLALAEQVIAIVAGCAPVVSAWVVRTVLAPKDTRGAPISPAAFANQPRTLTQRMRPDRESCAETPQERRLRKWKRSKASDPYPTLTTVQSTVSEERLRGGTPGDDDSVRRSDTWELGEIPSISKNDARENPGSIV